MTNRVSYAPQDFQKMCKQAERDSEARKLALLMDRVKKQIAKCHNNLDTQPEATASVTPINADPSLVRIPSRSVPLER